MNKKSSHFESRLLKDNYYDVNTFQQISLQD
jgi:hypothetical protein